MKYRDLGLMSVPPSWRAGPPDPPESPDPPEWGEIWVCVDCMAVDACGDEPDRPADSTEPETWALWPDSSMLANWTYDPSEPEAEEYGDGCREFSWSACEGCGSRLGGARYRYSVHDS